MASKGNRTHLRGVGNGQCLENTPRQTAENLGDQQGLDVLRGEEDGDEAGEANKGGDDGPAVAETLRDVAVDEEADDFADGDAVGEAGLPGGRDFVGSVGLELAEFLVELGEGEEVGDEGDVVSAQGVAS